MKTVLLIEDDEISQAFMTEAIALLPVECVACSHFSQALQLCQDRQFDLIISDIHTADGRLFDYAATLPRASKILAISADMRPEMIERLMQLGIHDTLAKPMSLPALHAVVRRLLELNTLDSTPVWDKQKALLALGQNEAILSSLKEMFRAELPLMTAQIQQAFECEHPEQIHETLHKLKASCGFLGANRLLQECVRLDADISAQNIERFMAVAKQTLLLI